MYDFSARTSQAEKEFENCKKSEDIVKKLKKLREDPRNNLNAHKLKGKLKGKWSCYLRKNLRMVYFIDDESKLIIVVSVGSHNKVYR
ncbi:MAG: type II toxin-antitoxin system RelE/ParE family toxin [Candidatus Pacearchaeota archaeon]